MFVSLSPLNQTLVSFAGALVSAIVFVSAATSLPIVA